MTTRRSRLLRALGSAAVLSLLAFHAALLGRRLLQPGALDAASLVRWAGTLGLVAAAFALRATSRRLTRRQLLALALAAVALHAPMLQGPADAERAAWFFSALPAALTPPFLLCAFAVPLSAMLAAAQAASQAKPRVARLAFVPRAAIAPRPPPID